MEIPTYVPSKVTIVIESNGQEVIYTFPRVGIITFDIEEYPLPDISDTITFSTPVRGIKSATLELTNILRDENQVQAVVQIRNKEM